VGGLTITFSPAFPTGLSTIHATLNSTNTIIGASPILFSYTTTQAVMVNCAANEGYTWFAIGS